MGWGLKMLPRSNLRGGVVFKMPALSSSLRGPELKSIPSSTSLLSWLPWFVHKDGQPLMLPSKDWLVSKVPAALPSQGGAQERHSQGPGVSAWAQGVWDVGPILGAPIDYLARIGAKSRTQCPAQRLSPPVKYPSLRPPAHSWPRQAWPFLPWGSGFQIWNVTSPLQGSESSSALKSCSLWVRVCPWVEGAGMDKGHLRSCFLHSLPVPHSLNFSDKFLADQDLVLTFTSCSVLGRKPCSTKRFSVNWEMK